MGEEQRQYATAEQLGSTEGYEEVQLPVLGSWVKVRYVDTPEVASASFLPDLADFTKLAAKINDGKQSEVDPAEWSIENLRFQAHLVHLAVMHPEADLDEKVLCEDCSVKRPDGTYEHEVKHPRSLWTPKQASRLQPLDTGTVANITVRANAFASVRPFSTDRTPDVSPEPARNSESTPPPSFSPPAPPSPIATL